MNYQPHWDIIYQYRHLLLDGLLATVHLVLAALPISVLLGLFVAAGRSFLRGRWSMLSKLCEAYVEFFRNIPPIVQFFFWNFAVGLGAFPAALVALSVSSSAYRRDHPRRDCFDPESTRRGRALIRAVGVANNLPCDPAAGNDSRDPAVEHRIHQHHQELVRRHDDRLRRVDVPDAGNRGALVSRFRGGNGRDRAVRSPVLGGCDPHACCRAGGAPRHPERLRWISASLPATCVICSKGSR